MSQVAVKLTSAWPTAAGLRRPVEGIIHFSEKEAEQIVAAGCGVLADDAGSAKKGKPKKAAEAPAPAVEEEPAESGSGDAG